MLPGLCTLSQSNLVRERKRTRQNVVEVDIPYSSAMRIYGEEPVVSADKGSSMLPQLTSPSSAVSFKESQGPASSSRIRIIVSERDKQGVQEQLSQSRLLNKM